MKSIVTIFVLSFITYTVLNAQTVTDADGNVYNTIQIGTQIWLKENLKTTKYNDGSSIPYLVPTYADTATTGSYCTYSNIPSNGAIFGQLYNWYVIADPRGVCPLGFDVSSDYDWSILISYLSANGYNYDGSTSNFSWNSVAKSIASTSYWFASINTGAVGNTDYPSVRNVTGFTALPSGFRDPVAFKYMGEFGVWWTSTSSATSIYAQHREISYSSVSVAGSTSWHKRTNLPIRCISNTLGIENLDNSNKTFIYPNPAKNYVGIYGLEKLNNIEIQNLNGQIVKKMNVSSNEIKIDVSDLPQGVYMIKLYSDRGAFVKKLIKQ